MAGTKGHSGGHNRLSIADHRDRGTYRASRHGGWTDPVVAAVPDAAVVKPTTLSTAGAQVWDVLAPVALMLGTLTRSDVWCFATLCELTASAELIAQDSTPSGRRQYRQTALAMLKHLELFGLAGPGSRTRLHLRPASGPSGDNPLNKFINRKSDKWAGILK